MFIILGYKVVHPWNGCQDTAEYVLRDGKSRQQLSREAHAPVEGSKAMNPQRMLNCPSFDGELAQRWWSKSGTRTRPGHEDICRAPLPRERLRERPISPIPNARSSLLSDRVWYRRLSCPTPARLKGGLRPANLGKWMELYYIIMPRWNNKKRKVVTPT